MDGSTENNPINPGITAEEAKRISKQQLAKINPEIYGNEETRTYNFDNLPPTVVEKGSGVPKPKSEPNTRTYQFDNLPPTVVEKGSGKSAPKQENPIKVQ
jgi:hypothetical protein